MADKHDHTPEEERRIREAALDETISESFPSSDPPSSLPNPDEHDTPGFSAAREKIAGFQQRGLHAFTFRPVNASMQQTQGLAAMANVFGRTLRSRPAGSQKKS
jgi:hypothetical protein